MSNDKLSAVLLPDKGKEGDRMVGAGIDKVFYMGKWRNIDSLTDEELGSVGWKTEAELDAEEAREESDNG